MKLLVLDGNSILNRAFYGIKLLTTKDGTYTNAVYGFLTMLQKLLEEVSPDAVAIAFDMRAPTFRHKAYDEYKAKRKGMPEELASQLPVLKELLSDLGYRLVECEGYEADDILGTFARVCEEKGDECVIATGDRDSLQLVSPHVSVRIAATKMGRPQATLYDAEKIKEVYGVTPPQLIDIKAIQGDASDNIPGVPGIGEKGALDLIGRFGSLEKIYEDIDTLDVKPGVKKKLIEGKDSAYLSRMLGTICKEVPIDTEIKDYVVTQGDKPAAVRLMAKLEFFSLIDKLGLRGVELPAETQEQKSAAPICKVAEESDLRSFAKTLKEKGTFSFLMRADGKKVQAMAFAFEGEVHYVKNGEGFETFCKAVFADTGAKAVTHDSKPFYAALAAMGIEAALVEFDTLLAAYLLNPSSSGYEIDRLCEEYALTPMQTDVQEEEEFSSLIKQAAALPGLWETLNREIQKNAQDKLLREIEIPLSRVLASMETLGFAVNEEGIRKYGEMLDESIGKIQAEVFREVGYEFNINSPKQLGQALFEKLGLPTGKKNKSGYSTSADVLEGLRYAHPAVDLVLQFRMLSKLKSTYCDGMLKVIGGDGRIHSNFNQVETRTGRISSTEPNLQNIPVRTELGRELRRFFCAKTGDVLVDADYSQIELRVLAHVANDKAMIEAFQNDDDIHAITASQVFHMPLSMVTPLMRSRAKAVNFGIVYGIGAFSLSKDIGVTRKEADQYIKDYLRHYSGVDNYMKSVVDSAKDKGYAETIFGRRRYLPELSSSNFNLRAFGERVARNMPIQGAAADIIKIAMIRVYDRLKKEKLQARLILQVHDELIVEAPKEEAGKVAALLTEEMQNAAKLSVTLTADAGVGETWFDAKG